MEVANFLKLLRKHRIALILIPLITVIGSFFLVKNLAKSYISHAQIATGIVDASRHLVDKETSTGAQEQQVTRDFSNLITTMKLNKILNQVSYQCIIHDLTNPEPFRALSKQVTAMRPNERVRALAIFKSKLAGLQPLSLFDKTEDHLNDVLISMKYDERSLLKNLTIARDEDSDFISVTYESENPLLSAYIVNVLCKQFIDYYTQNVRQNESNTVNYLSKLLDEKKKALSEKTEELQKYKIQHGVLSLDEQSKAIFDQIMVYNDKKQQAEKDMLSYTGAIKSIDSKFNPSARKYVESKMIKYNQSITNTQDQLHVLEDKYVRSGFNSRYKSAIDSIQNVLASQVDMSSDRYVTNPLVAKDDLLHQKLTLEVSRDLAKYSVKSIGKELDDLNTKFARLVPFDATVKTYNFDIDIAGKEYLDVLNRYNEANLKTNFSTNLRQVQVAIPDIAQPSKKILLMALSAVVSVVLCLFVMFVLFYLDKSIKDPAALVNKTQLPLLGYLNQINIPNLDLKKLWDVEHRDKMKEFKELLRSIRFEIDQELAGKKVVAITSLAPNEGKTLLATSLAYSYSIINKRVLLIDGNFDNPTISNISTPQTFVEEHFKNNNGNARNIDSNTTTVLGNHGNDITPFEIGSETFIKSQFDDLCAKYDLIIIDTAPLSGLNKSKEWLIFADKVMAVFESGKSISNVQKPDIAYLRSLDHKFAGWILNKSDFKPKKA